MSCAWTPGLLFGPNLASRCLWARGILVLGMAFNPRAVVCWASVQATFVTGAEIVIDGGYRAR